MNDRHFMRGKNIKCTVMFFVGMYLAFPEPTQQADLVVVLPGGILLAMVYLSLAETKRYDYLNINYLVHQYKNMQTKKDICRDITRHNAN